MLDEFKITPKYAEPNYVPNGVELPTEQTGFAIDDAPATNEKPMDTVVNWDDVESVNKPEDNATKRKIFAQNSAPTKDFKEGDVIKTGIYYIHIHYLSKDGKHKYDRPSLCSYHEREDFKPCGCTPGADRPYYIDDFLNRRD